MLVVEQNIKLALDVADRFLVLKDGLITERGMWSSPPLPKTSFGPYTCRFSAAVLESDVTCQRRSLGGSAARAIRVVQQGIDPAGRTAPCVTCSTSREPASSSLTNRTLSSITASAIVSHGSTIASMWGVNRTLKQRARGFPAIRRKAERL